jgi:hypothetical protein
MYAHRQGDRHFVMASSVHKSEEAINTIPPVAMNVEKSIVILENISELFGRLITGRVSWCVSPTKPVDARRATACLVSIVRQRDIA